MDRLDRLAAFFSALGCVWGGIPALFVAVYLGLLFAGGNGNLTWLFFELVGTQLRSNTVLFTLPAYATCLLLLLYSEISRARIFYIAFAISSVATAITYSDSYAPKTWRLVLLIIPPAATYMLRRIHGRLEE